MRNAATERDTVSAADPVPLQTAAAPNDELAAAMAEFDKIYETRQNVPPLVDPLASVQPRTPEQSVAAPIFAIQDPPPAPEVQRVPQPSSLATPLPPPVGNPVVAEPLREVVTAPEVYSASASQSTIDERFEAMGVPHKRDISSIDAITTSALVLPNFPTTSPITGPVSGTGQILMTGSIALPRSLGVNGLHPSRYDRPDIDSIIDAADREDSAPNSAPVRAVRAVSTYTSPQGVLNTKRPKGNNLPMILSITAGVMMVGVVVLVVAGMIFKIF